MPSDEDSPLFARIEKIIVEPNNDGKQHSILIKEIITLYDAHYNAYKVDIHEVDVYRMICIEDIAVPDSFTIHSVPEVGQFIIIRSCYHVDLSI